MTQRRGISRVELVIVLVIIVVIIALAIVGLRSARQQAMFIKEGSQIRGVHQSWLIMSREFNGQMVVPGAIALATAAAPSTSGMMLDFDNMDALLNTTASLYSVSIMHNYFSPELCVGPTEPSGNVFVHDTYNWDLYNPLAGVWWDPAFAADLQTGSNVSYAHMPLFGKRLEKHWSETLDETFAILGTRGPKDGVDDPASLTYQIMGPSSQWVGNIIYNDNHVETISGGFMISGGTDNLFKMEDGPDGLDAFLGITTAMTSEGPLFTWD